MQFDFSVWSLLRGQTEVVALELERPTIYLRQDTARLAEMKLRRGRIGPGGMLDDILDRLRKRKVPPQ